MRNKWGIRNYIDLMAGPGRNRVRGTNKVLLGSPLLALATKHPFTGYYFVDLEKKNTDALAERCSAAQAGSVNVRTGDCNQEVHAIVAALRHDQNRSLNLAFLDPEGLELHRSTIAKLASIRRMDLIINYPEGGLNRLMKKSYQQDADTLVDYYFGDRGWRTIYENWLARPGRGLHRQLIDHYKGKLHDLGYVDVRGIDGFDDEPLMRNVKRNAPLYRLLFASKHPLAEQFWRDITKRDVHGQMRLFDSD